LGAPPARPAARIPRAAGPSGRSHAETPGTPPHAARRTLLAGIGAAPLAALAGPLAGPAEAKGALRRFWHENQQDKLPLLLAPLKASRDKLVKAERLAAAGDADGYAAAVRAVRDAGLNCYAYPDGDASDGLTSFYQRVSSAQEGAGGAEVCTARLVVKNVAVRRSDEGLKDALYDTLADWEARMFELDAALLGALGGDGGAAGRLDGAFSAAVEANERLQDGVADLVNLVWE